MHFGVVPSIHSFIHSWLFVHNYNTSAHISHLVATYTMWEKSLYPYLIYLVYIYVHSMCVWYTIEPESVVWQHCQSHRLAEHS